MKKSYWKHKNTRWVCPNHIPSAILPAQISNCWFSNCSGVRPPMIKDKVTTKCAWFKCNKDNGKPAARREKSKYCSIQCKNDYARHRHKERKKKLKI